MLAVLRFTTAASIEFTDFRVEFPSDQSFRLTMYAKGTGIRVGSYGMRTFTRTRTPLSGFVSRSGFQYLATRKADAKHRHMLLDNGPDDENPAAGVLVVTVSTKGWPHRVHTMLAYADNRPARGSYVCARSRLRITISNGRIDVAKSGRLDMLYVRIKDFRVQPPEIEPGAPVRVRADYETNQPGGVETNLSTPYTVAPNEVPPGFEYDAKTKMAWLRNAEPDGSFLISTDKWPPGVQHLTLNAEAKGTEGQARDYRDFAVKVRGQNMQLEVSINSDVLIGPGTHFGCFCKLSDGSVLAHGRVSRDAGRTWQRLGPDIPMAHELSDGQIVGLGFHTQPVPDRPGHFTGQLHRSADRGKTVQRVLFNVHIPRATGGIGHAAVKGPLFWRSIVELPHGALLAAMYGWFKGDDVPVPGQPGSTRYRTFIAQSLDRGKSWALLTTVAYDPAIGTEGYCEPVIRRLPNGDLLCLLRTGGNNRPFWQDNPLCQTRSTDGGKTWATPGRTGVEGVSPDLCVMADGTLACSYGRPGADLMFSTDNGRTWTDHTPIHPERYSGYTAVCEVEPGVLLYGYGVMDCLDEATGKRSNQLRAARITVRRR